MAFRKVSSFIYDQKRVSTQLQWEALFFFLYVWRRARELAHSTELIENLRVSGKRAESDVLPGPKHLPAERPPHVPSPSAFFSHHAYLCNLPQ